MKGNFLTRLFGSGEKETAVRHIGTCESSTSKADPAEKAGSVTELSAEEIKRNADFWDSVNRNMGDAHGAAAKACINRSLSVTERRDLATYQKAVIFAGLITSTNGGMERAKKKYHKDDLFQIFRNVTMEDLL